MGVGVAVMAANLAAGAWGGAAWLRGEPSVWFWYVLRFAQVVVMAQAALGFTLLATDRRAVDDLHYVYGFAPLVIALVTEAMRAGAGERILADVDDVHALERGEQLRLARQVAVQEMGVMALGCLLITTLALRAFTTGS